jgi:release factor glutamine methyltransferase
MNPNDSQLQEPMTATNDVASWLSVLREQLTGVSETALLDAQVAIAHLIERPRAWVVAHPEALLEPSMTDRLAQAATRLAMGEPLPYVLGSWEFFGLEFEVGPAVLIPRPETELLVETALDWLRSHPAARRTADVGTGSGCIAIALAVNIPDLVIYASDRSYPALQVARRNAARRSGSGSIHFFQGDLLNGLKTSLDLICANLPYIPHETLGSLPVAAHEPALALDGGPEGLAVIRRFVSDVPRLLAPGGICLLEIDASQGSTAVSMAQSVFPGAKIRLSQDLNRQDRLLSIEIE